MSTSPSFVALVTAAMLGIAAGTAWSADTAPKAGGAQGWYPPPPPGGYAQHWQPQGQQAVQPYGGSPYYYPPRQPEQAAARPAAAETTTASDDPLAAELARVKEQLAATKAELEQSENSHKETRAAAAELEKKLAGLGREHKALQVRATELAGELNVAMPRYVINKLQLALNARKKAVNGSRVLVNKPAMSHLDERPVVLVTNWFTELQQAFE